VASALVRAGARVPCFTTTRAATRDAAGRHLADRCGIEARGYTNPDEMLARERLDALAILSPAETHAALLESALAAGLHALCEKPLVWGRPDLAADGVRLVDAFDRAGLQLWENCQWPYTLPAYERLFPGSLDRPPEHFFMSMQPASAGTQAFADSLPHVFSLLQALVPGEAPSLDDARFATPNPERGDQTAAFRYRTDRWSARADVHLKPTDASPREAAFALDGRLARRRVEGESYRLSFESDDGRSVPLDDPMTLLVADFVAALRRGRPRARSARSADRMSLLAQLVEAKPSEVKRS
jgi:predicted dehydrogenase